MKPISRSLVIGILLGIATGAGGGYLLFSHPSSAAPKGDAGQAGPDAAQLRADLDSAQRELQAARATIDRLREDRQRRLAEALAPSAGTEAAPGAEAQAAAEPAPEERPRDDQRGNWWQQLERMRETEPDRYADIQNRIQRTRQAYTDYRAGQYAILDERTQAAVTTEEQQLYQDIKTRLQTIDQLVAQMADPNNEAPRREIFETMRQTQEELRELGQVDRQYQLMGLADHVGVRDLGAAEQFAEEVGRIYEETESYSSWRGAMDAARIGFMGGGGMPGGGMPGGGMFGGGRRGGQ